MLIKIDHKTVVNMGNVIALTQTEAPLSNGEWSKALYIVFVTHFMKVSQCFEVPQGFCSKIPSTELDFVLSEINKAMEAGKHFLDLWQLFVEKGEK